MARFLIEFYANSLCRTTTFDQDSMKSAVLQSQLLAKKAPLSFGTRSAGSIVISLEETEHEASDSTTFARFV